MSTTEHRRPAPFITGLAGATIVTLIGVWLVVAPFAVGYQPDGAEWVDATIVGVASGVTLILLGLLALLSSGRALRAEARGRSRSPAVPGSADAEREADAVAAADQPHPAHTGDLNTILALLAAALLEDVQDGRTDPT